MVLQDFPCSPFTNYKCCEKDPSIQFRMITIGGSGTGKSKLVKKIYNKEHSFKYKIEYPPTLQSFKQENYDPFVEENKLDLNNDKEINKFIMSEKSMDDNDDNNSKIKGVKDAFLSTTS